MESSKIIFAGIGRNVDLGIEFRYFSPERISVAPLDDIIEFRWEGITL